MENNMQLEMLILQGPPRSGKTTFAYEFIEKNPKYVRVSRDDQRSMRGKYWRPEQEDLISEWEEDAVWSALHHGYNVIIDATNLNPITISKWERIAKSLDAKVTFKFFDTPLDVCLQRDAESKEPRGEKVIRGFFKRYLEGQRKSVDLPVNKIVQDETKMKAIICDLDGTMCLMTDRLAYEEKKCGTDKVNIAVRTIVEAMYPTHKIIYVSGRKDTARIETLMWLAIWVKNPGYCILHMRKADDNRDDRIIKKEIFDEHIKDKYFIEFVLDDRDKVVKMWRDMGLTCLQVAYGNF